MKSPVKLLRSLLEDIRRLHPGARGLDRDIITIENRVEHEGFSFLSKTLGSLSDAIRDGLEHGTFTCPRNFSKVPRGVIPRLFSGILCDVFDPITGVEKDDVKIDSLLSIEQLCRLFKKCVPLESESNKLYSQAVDTFFDTEDELSPGITDDTFLFFVSRVSKVILPSLATEDIDPKHGPGAVYEGYDSNQKWSELSRAIIEDGYMRDEFFDWFAVLDSDLVGSENRNTYEEPFLPFVERIAPSSMSRLCPVPKNSTSARTITVEPLLNQFAQQGLKGQLRSSISACPILSQCIDISDQTHNQKLALEGSLHGSYATLDLKSASDLLSVELVQQIFKYKGDFLADVLRTRSSHVEYDKCSKVMRKFAGMGNALTFPVQSVCFAVLCIASIIWGKGQAPSYRNIKAAASTIRIYGDDIIVPTDHTSQVVRGLELAGLKVNKTKSFSKGNFRESCGSDCYKGVEITPMYIRYVPESLSGDARAIASLVAACNQSWERAYYKLSATLLEYIEGFLKRKLHMVSKRSSALGLHTRLDAYDCRYYNRRLHRYEILAPTIQPRYKRSRIDGYAALLKSFMLPIEGRLGDHLERSPKRYQSKIVLRRVPS